MPGLTVHALRIIRERYVDFGPTLACDKLAEIHGLYLAVRKLMDGEDLNVLSVPSLCGFSFVFF